MEAGEQGIRILLIMLGMIAVLLICSGCAGFTDNAKSIHIQIPALLDVEFQYNEKKGISENPGLKGLITDKD